MAEVPQDHRFENAKGEIYHKLTKKREVMLNTDSWHAMMRELHDRFSTGADTILFDSGRAFGSDIIQKIAKEIPDPLERTRFLSRFAAASGWGSFQVRTDDRGAIVTSPNNAFADTGRATTSPSCFFLKGVIKGLYDVILESGCIVNETTCRSKGDSVCRFEISRK